MPAKININKNKLEELYVFKRWTQKQCADFFNVTRPTIRNKLKKYRIERPKSKLKNDFEISNGIVTMKIVCKDKTYNCSFDEDDLDCVSKYNHKWYGDEMHEGNIYAKITVQSDTNSKQTTILLHRVIMNFPKLSNNFLVDHIDGNTLNNCKSNLRVATPLQNTWNSKIQKNNTSGYRGVRWNKENKKWQVDIVFNNNRKYLGLYDELDKAIKIRKKAEEKYWGKKYIREEYLEGDTN